MSISSELQTLNNTKTAIRTAINNKGGSVGASDTFASYATAIDNLPSGGSGNPVLESIDVSDISGTTFGKARGYITNVTFPSGITQIANSAFYGCTGLTSISVPEGVTTIGQEAFSDCTGLLYAVIPSTVTSTGGYMFQGCTSLLYLVFLETTPPPYGANMLNNTNNCPIYVPSTSVAAYKAESGWISYVASRIYGIEQVATVDNTPVYNYDLGMTSTTMITSTNMQKMPTGTSLELAEGIVDAGGSFGNYTSITLPSTFSSFDDQGMIGNTTTTLTSKATTPPTAERDDFGGAGLTAIYVPASAVDTYKAASGWSNFASIIEGISSPSITIELYKQSNPADWGDFEGCSETQNVDVIPAASSSSTFDSDIKASGSILVEDNNGNDVTSQCTFTSSDYSKWDSTQDPSYDGKSEAYYEWRLDTNIEDADAQNPHSATITATYGNLSDTFTIEWTTTSNCEEPEPDPEEPEE